jgi:hypothetical protein
VEGVLFLGGEVEVEEEEVLHLVVHLEVLVVALLVVVVQVVDGNQHLKNKLRCILNS